ncbi:MAG: Ig domain-containing protein [Candidatus Thiodiazotropha sp.]|nr:Ig domain-containing protein [Candidatus Thiodiazotropha sp.]
MKHSKILICTLMVLGISTMLIIASCEDAGTSSTSSPTLISLAYSPLTLDAVVWTEIPQTVPTIEPQGATAEYTVNPELPEGLTLNSSSGVISGIPRVGHSSTPHTVTAKGTGDYTETRMATITITVSPVSAQEIPRSESTFESTGLKPDDYRTNFVAFSIQAEPGDYRLAVKANAAPAATEIRASSATIVRTLGETAINVYLSFHIDTTLFDAATSWKDVGGASILTNAMVDEALLQADTDYGLYAVSESNTTDSTVHHLFDFRTNAEPSTSILTDTSKVFFYNVPPDNIFTLRKSEPFLYFNNILNVFETMALGNTHYATGPSHRGDLSQISNNNGIAIPAISGKDTSIYFVGKGASTTGIDIGRGVMVSKTYHANTNLISGTEFSLWLKVNTSASTKFVVQ